ncbi:MAG: LytR C-terminal domain-containing protein [Jatrophihabitantaceae bacterium]
MNRATGRTSRLIERRRRRERLTGVALAAVGVAVLVVAIIALRSPDTRSVRPGHHVAKSSTSHPSASRTTSTARTTSSTPTMTQTTTAAVAKLSLVVLNNTTTQGLAQQAAQRFEAGGWPVSRYDNYQNDILSTCAYYDPSVSGAKASAEALRAQYPTIKRVIPQFAELASYNSPIVVVLTPDYSPN